MEEKLKVSQFATQINSIEYQKTYLFRIHLPRIVTKMSGIINPGDGFHYCTASTAFPVMNSEATKVAFYNSEFKISAKTTFQDWNATFRLNLTPPGSTPVATGQFPDWGKYTANISQGQTIFQKLLAAKNIPLGKETGISTFRYFYEWQLMAYNSSTRVSNLPCYYKQPISLLLLNELGQEQTDVSFTLDGAFPVRISGGNLDYSNDSILTYSVDFAFDRFFVGVTAPPNVT
jgi:hypothetical protein